MTHEWFRWWISYLMWMRSYPRPLNHWARLSNWAFTFSLFSVDHSSRQAMLPGQLALAYTIWKSYSPVMPIIEKFQVLNFTFRESLCHLMRHPAVHLQGDVVIKKCLGRILTGGFKVNYNHIKAVDIWWGASS